MAFAPSGHLRNRPLDLRLPSCESAENDMDLRAATEPLDTVVATFCALAGCLAFAPDNRKEEPRREDSSLDVIVATSEHYYEARC